MRGKWMAAALLAALLAAIGPPAYALEATELVPVGETVGIRLDLGGVSVAGLNAVQTAQGEVRPAEDAGIRPGDVITRIGARETPDAASFLTAVASLDGGSVEVTALRGGSAVRFTVTPARSAEGVWQLGLWLRDGMSGIGTVTFYDPASGTYGALGHGISDLDSGELLPFRRGEVRASTVADVIPGRAGAPGELCGAADADAAPIGTVAQNTPAGIFGSAAFDGAPVPVAEESETVLGPATILANVAGDAVEAYDVEISRIYRGADDHRFLLLTVTDRDLLERTGGIVQGMSGSPILQGGKLVGAVTHVLLNDPTRGYGISIRDMLDAAAA